MKMIKTMVIVIISAIILLCIDRFPFQTVLSVKTTTFNGAPQLGSDTTSSSSSGSPESSHKDSHHITSHKDSHHTTSHKDSHTKSLQLESNTSATTEPHLNPPTGASGGTPPTGASGGTPPTGASGGTPPTGASGGTPPTGGGSAIGSALEGSKIVVRSTTNSLPALGSLLGWGTPMNLANAPLLEGTGGGSLVDASLTGVSGGTPPTGASGGTPPTGASGGTPPTGASGGTPPTGGGSNSKDLQPSGAKNVPPPTLMQSGRSNNLREVLLFPGGSLIVPQSLVSVVHISPVDAASSAEQVVGTNSRVISAGLGVQAGNLEYTIWVMDAQNNLHKVAVDPVSGIVVSNQPILMNP